MSDNPEDSTEESSEDAAPEEPISKRTWKEIQFWARNRPKGKFISIPKKRFGVWYELRNTGNETILLAITKDPDTNEIERIPVDWEAVPSFEMY